MPLKFHSALPAAALEYFSESCVQDAMRHPGRGSSHALPMSALDLFSTSALQHFWRSTGGHLGAITLSALELFEGSQVQQAVEDERASFLLTPPELPQVCFCFFRKNYDSLCAVTWCSISFVLCFNLPSVLWLDSPEELQPCVLFLVDMMSAAGHAVCGVIDLELTKLREVRHVLQGQAAAVQRVAASSDPHEDPQPTPLRTESSLRRALSTMTFGLMFSDHPIAAVAPSKQPKSDAQAPTPQVTARPETPLPTSYTAAPVLAAEGSTLSSSGVSFVPGFPFIPGVLYSSSPILAAVQPAEQPLTDPIFADRVPNCTPIDPTTSQEGIAEAEDTSASALDFAAGGASPTSSSEVKGILESNSSSLADAMQQADKAALDQTPQAAKPKV